MDFALIATPEDTVTETASVMDHPPRQLGSSGYWAARSGGVGRVPSLLRHPGHVQTSEISALEHGADFRCAEIFGGRQMSDARITTIGGEPAGFGEFRGGAFGLAFESIGGRQVSAI